MVEIGMKMKITWRYKIISAVLTGLFYTGLLFLFDNFFEEPLYSRTNLIVQGVAFGLFFGFGFPYLIQKFSRKNIVNAEKNMQLELETAELIEAKGPANLFRGQESVGGTLFLTNKKIIFKAHKLNIQTGQTDIDYHNVAEISKRKTLGIIDNGINVTTKDNKNFDFVLNDREQWMEMMNEKLVL